MPFLPDINAPSDSSLIPSYPANARAHRTTLRDVIEIEHDFAEGRHKFVSVADDGAQDAITTWVDGSIIFRTDQFTGETTFRRYDGANWIDVAPPINVPRTDDGTQTYFTAQQWATWVQVTPSGGNIAIDMELSPAKYATVSTDVVITNPTNMESAQSGVVLFELFMSGGGHTISWGNVYIAANGFAPAYTDLTGRTNFFTLSTTRSGAVLVTSSPDVGSF